MLFPLVTTFETTGTYKKWLWPNSAYITYTWHALLLWHIYLHTHTHTHIYICTTSARICTPLIVSRSLRSLANHIYESTIWERVYMYVKRYTIAQCESKCLNWCNSSQNCTIFHMIPSQYQTLALLLTNYVLLLYQSIKNTHFQCMHFIHMPVVTSIIYSKQVIYNNTLSGGCVCSHILFLPNFYSKKTITS